MRKAMLLLPALTNALAQEPSMGVKVQVEKNPLAKVLTLLKEMKAQVETEAKEDTAAYEKYECWCTKNDKEKTAAIAEAEARIADLTSFLEEAVGKEGQLKTQIEGLANDIKEDQDALASATGMRQEENDSFKLEEADMKETLAALKSAIDVLSKVQLLQKGQHVPGVAADAKKASVALLQVKEVLGRHFPQFKAVMQRDLFDMLGALQTEAGQKEGAAFLGQKNPNYWEPTEEEAGMAAKKNGLQGAAAGAKSYNSRSGQIFGVLSSMSDQFLRDLSNAQKEEYSALVEFQHLRAAKEAEIAAAEAQKKEKETQLADLLAKAATAKEDLANMEAARAADTEFLANLKETCTQEANDYEGRVKVRTEEIKALGETLNILTEDDARDVFGKTLSFVQLASISSGKSVEAAADSSASQAALQDRAADRAMKRIATVAKKHKNWALVSLAVRVRLDSFTKVIEMLDKMMGELKQQQKAEYEKNDACKQALDETEDKIKVAEQQKKDLGETHMSHEDTLSQLANTIDQLKADVHASEVSLKQAGEARKAENQVFMETVSDQRATAAILKKALARLQAFYTPEAQLVQVHAHAVAEPGAAVEAPPPAPKDYEKSASSGGALQLIAKIISDVEAEEGATMASEQHAQKGYESLVKDTQASIEADRAAIAKAEEEVAGTSVSKSETEESQLANGEELDNLNGLLKAHHVDCDWLMKYFDVRQTARQEEMDAIADAKAILSGASFGK